MHSLQISQHDPYFNWLPQLSNIRARATLLSILDVEVPYLVIDLIIGLVVNLVIGLIVDLVIGLVVDLVVGLAIDLKRKNAVQHSFRLGQFEIGKLFDDAQMMNCNLKDLSDHVNIRIWVHAMKLLKAAKCCFRASAISSQQCQNGDVGRGQSKKRQKTYLVIDLVIDLQVESRNQP